MKRNALLAIIGLIAVVLIGLLLWGGSDSPEETANSEEEAAYAEIDTGFRVNTTNTYSDGSTRTTLLEYEDRDTYRVLTEDNGFVELIYDGEDVYVKNGKNAEYTKFKKSDIETNSEVNPILNLYQGNEDISKYTSGNSLGQQECVAGTCDAYEYTFESNDRVGIVRIADGKVYEIETTLEDGSTINAEYTYDSEIKVEIPTKFEDFNFNEEDPDPDQ